MRDLESENLTVSIGGVMNKSQSRPTLGLLNDPSILPCEFANGSKQLESLQARSPELREPLAQEIVDHVVGLPPQPAAMAV